jgi:HK97 family phage portal protein
MKIRELIGVGISEGWGTAFARAVGNDVPDAITFPEWFREMVSWRDWNVRTAIKEGLKANWVVYRCVVLKARMYASLPWIVRRTLQDGTIETVEDPNHPLVQLLRSPNPYQTWTKLLYLDSMYADLAGDFILYTTDENSDTGGEIPWTVYPLQTQRVTIKALSPFTSKYTYRVGETEEIFEQEEVVHIQQPDPGSDTYGLATLRAAGRAVDTGNSVHDAQKASMEQVVKPSGIISGEFGKEVYERLKADIKKNKAGAKNVGKVLIARANVKFQPFMLTPAEVDYINSIGATNDEIAAALEVDPSLLGIRDTKYENKREARKFLEQTCIFPRAIDSRDAWNLQLIPRMGLTDGSFLDFDISQTATAIDLRRANAEEAKLYAESLHASPQAINQRLDLGFNADDLPDEALVPMTLVPISQIGDLGGEPSGDVDEEDERSLSTKARLARYWRVRDVQKIRFEKAVAGRVREVFIEEGKRVLEAWNDGERDLDGTIDSMAGAYRDVFRAAYAGTIEFFGNQTSEDLSERVRVATPGEVRFEFELGDPAVQAFIERETIRTVTDVTTSTKKSIRKLVSVATSGDQTQTADEIALGLQGKYRRWYGLDPELAFERSRSFRIARTVVHTGSGFGQYEAAAQSRIVTMHVWLTSRDGRVRDIHGPLEGQKVAFGERFSNGLLYPGDPAGGPGEIVNCRCNEIYLTKGEE